MKIDSNILQPMPKKLDDNDWDRLSTNFENWDNNSCYHTNDKFEVVSERGIKIYKTKGEQRPTKNF